MQIQSNQQIAQPGLDSANNSSATGKLAGKTANGERVAVQTSASSPLAKAADLAEEIVQFVKDNRKTDLKDRRVKKGSDDTEEMRKRVEKIQTVQNVQEIKDFLQKLKADPNLTRQQVQEKLKEAFDDDTLHEFMGLNEAARFFDEQGDKKKADLLKSVRNEHFSDNKVAIKSGINISEQAAIQAAETGLSDTRELRETHVELLGGEKAAQTVLDHVSDLPTLKDLYKELVSTHGSNNFTTAVDVHLKLLSTDLLSFNASTSPERLKAVIGEMSDLKTMVGIHDGCLETEDQTKRIYPQTDLIENKLMEHILDISQQQWVTESDFIKILPQLNVNDLDAQIFFMTKVDDLIRQLPEELFPNIETKQNIQAAVKESLDSLIEQENEEEVIETLDSSDNNFGILGDIGLDLPDEKER